MQLGEEKPILKMEEESIFSENKRNEIKIREFKQYLVNHDILLAIVKFLLSVRNAKERPDDPIAALNDYFGQLPNPQAEEYEQLEEEIQKIYTENESLKQTITELQNQIEIEKENKAQRELEEQERKIAEEQMAQKKGGRFQKK